jgi:hypothetical protein
MAKPQISSIEPKMGSRKPLNNKQFIASWSDKCQNPKLVQITSIGSQQPPDNREKRRARLDMH